MEDIARNILYNLPKDVFFYLFKLDISRLKSIYKILEKSKLYRSLYDSRNREESLFYSHGGREILLKVIGQMILGYGYSYLDYGAREKSFVPVHSDPKNFETLYPGALFEFKYTETLKFGVIGSWYKYRIAHSYQNREYYILDNESKAYYLGKKTHYYYFSTLYFCLLKEDLLLIFLDKPWIEEEAILKTHIENIQGAKTEIRLLETVYGLIFVHLQTIMFTPDYVTYVENLYKVDLENKKLQHLRSEKYSAPFLSEMTMPMFFYYGSSMIYRLERKEIFKNFHDWKKSLRNYISGAEYKLDETKLGISSLRETGLVGYDVAEMINGSNMVVNNSGDVVNMFIQSQDDFVSYFESLRLAVEDADNPNGFRTVVYDLLSGKVLASDFHNVVQEMVVYATRRDDMTGYYIWIDYVEY